MARARGRTNGGWEPDPVSTNPLHATHDTFEKTYFGSIWPRKAAQSTWLKKPGWRRTHLYPQAPAAGVLKTCRAINCRGALRRDALGIFGFRPR